MKLRAVAPFAVVILAAMNSHAQMAEAEKEAKLAAAAQNPLAALISLPFQNNTTFGGIDGDYVNVLNIQPVWPFHLSENWNLITRTIVPVVSQSENGNSQGGLGKIVKIRKLPVNLNAQLYYNVEKPADTGDYTARIQVQFMFPK